MPLTHMFVHAHHTCPLRFFFGSCPSHVPTTHVFLSVRPITHTCRLQICFFVQIFSHYKYCLFCSKPITHARYTFFLALPVNTSDSHKTCVILLLNLTCCFLLQWRHVIPNKIYVQNLPDAKNEDGSYKIGIT